MEGGGGGREGGEGGCEEKNGKVRKYNRGRWVQL